MLNLTLITSILHSILIAGYLSAQVRGQGRVHGIITDKETGKPVAGAKVTVTAADTETKPVIAKTDSRGNWAALGLTSGTWNIDIVAEGYEPAHGSASVSELQMSPPIKTGLIKAQQEQQQ